jgi:hypothetical protein
MKRVFIALVVLLGFQSFSVAQGLPSPSFWQNQRGSTLELYFVDPSGTFQGQFINQAKDYKCKGIPYAAVGNSTGAAVVFSVAFLQCSSHATWYGVVNGNTMRTNWVLLYAPPNGPPQKFQGSDVFTRVR